jgi:hypothetical protein
VLIRWKRSSLLKSSQASVFPVLVSVHRPALSDSTLTTSGPLFGWLDWVAFEHCVSLRELLPDGCSVPEQFISQYVCECGHKRHCSEVLTIILFDLCDHQNYSLLQIRFVDGEDDWRDFICGRTRMVTSSDR